MMKGMQRKPTKFLALIILKSKQDMTLEDEQEMIYTSFEKNFKVKDGSFFTGTWGDQGKWPRVLVYNDSDFPLTHEKYKEIISKSGSSKDGNSTGSSKSVNCNFVVIDGIQSGFTKVPLYKEGGSFKNSDGAKPMCKVVESERLPGLGFNDIHCWPWTMIRESPQAKGLLRDGPDDSNLAWKLQPGMVIRHRIWEDSMKGYPTKDKKPTSKELNINGAESMDYIPAFTVMIVDIAIKAWCPRIKGEEFLDTVTGQKKSRDEKDLSPVMKQYGMAISDMKIANGSLYSCAAKIRDGCILSTHMHSEAMQKEHVEKNWAIANSLQTGQAPMFVRDLAPDTYFLCDEENGIVKLTQWSSGVEEMPIDVKFEDVKRFTNSDKIEDGLALMEFSCQAGCLEMLCMHNKYRRKRSDENPIYSEIYGVPIIDVSKLLGCIKIEKDTDSGKFIPLKEFDDTKYFEFDADYRVTSFSDDGETPGKLYRPKILVSKEPTFVSSSQNIPKIGCQDLSLITGKPNTSTPSYEIKFINTITGGVACKVYFVFNKPSTLMNKSSCGNITSGGVGSKLVRKRWASGNLLNDPESIIITDKNDESNKKIKHINYMDEEEANTPVVEEEETVYEEEEVEEEEVSPPPVFNKKDKKKKNK